MNSIKFLCFIIVLLCTSCGNGSDKRKEESEPTKKVLRIPMPRYKDKDTGYERDMFDTDRKATDEVVY